MQAIILMADIQNSSLQNQRILAQQFSHLIQVANKQFQAELRSPLTITLGDEFQGIPQTIESGLKIIFHLEESILKKGYTMKLRYILQVGRIETPINSRIAYGMMGKGLTDSRNQLNLLKKEKNRFKIKTTRIAQTHVLNQAFLLYQSLVDTWKPKDQPIVSSFLTLKDYKKVAIKHQLNPSSTWRRQKSLNIAQYNSIKEILLYLG